MYLETSSFMPRSTLASWHYSSVADIKIVIITCAGNRSQCQETFTCSKVKVPPLTPFLMLRVIMCLFHGLIMFYDHYTPAQEHPKSGNTHAREYVCRSRKWVFLLPLGCLLVVGRPIWG